MAQKYNTASGTVVVITDKQGNEVFRSAADSSALLRWLSTTDQLYVVTGSTVTLIDASSGSWAESIAPKELPEEIEALVQR